MNLSESTSLREAVRRGDIAAVEATLATAQDTRRRELVNTLDRYDRSPLFIACSMGRVEIVKLLVSAGADVNARTGSGATALHAVCESNTTAPNTTLNMTRFLINHGANTNLIDNLQKSPIFYAVINNKADIVRHLALSGARLDMRPQGRSLLWFAPQDPHMVTLLLSYKLDINDCSCPPLIQLCEDDVVFRVCMSWGANINLVCDCGSPLLLRYLRTIKPSTPLNTVKRVITSFWTHGVDIDDAGYDLVVASLPDRQELGELFRQVFIHLLLVCRVMP